MVVVDDFDLGDGLRDISHYERWLGLKKMKLISLDRLDDVKEIVGEPTDEYRAYLGNGHFLLERLDKLMKMIDSASLPPNASQRFTSEQLDVFGHYTNELMQKMLIDVREIMPRLVQQFGLNLEGLTLASQESAKRKKEIDDLKSLLAAKQVDCDSLRRQNSYFLAKFKKEAIMKKAAMSGVPDGCDTDDEDELGNDADELAYTARDLHIQRKAWEAKYQAEHQQILQDRIDAVHDVTQKRISDIREEVNAENNKCRKDVNEANARALASEAELQRVQELIQSGQTPTYTAADLGTDTLACVSVSSIEDPSGRSREASRLVPRDMRAQDSRATHESSASDTVQAIGTKALELPKAAARGVSPPSATVAFSEVVPGAAQGADLRHLIGTPSAPLPAGTFIPPHARAPEPGLQAPGRTLQVSTSAGASHFPTSAAAPQKDVARHIMPDPASDAVQGLVVAEKKMDTVSVKGQAKANEQEKAKRKPRVGMARRHAVASALKDSADSSSFPPGAEKRTSASSSALGAPRKSSAVKPKEAGSNDDTGQRPRSAASSVNSQKRLSRLKMRAKGDAYDAREQMSGDSGSHLSSYMYDDSVLQDRRPLVGVTHAEGHSVADAFASDVFSSRLITLEKIIHVMLQNRMKNSEEIAKLHAAAKRDLETRWTHRHTGASDVLCRAQHSDDCLVATGALRSDELHHLRIFLGLPTLGTEETPIDKRVVAELGLLRRLQARFDAIIDSDSAWLDKTFTQPFDVDNEMDDVISPLVEDEDFLPPDLLRTRPSSAPFRQGVKSWKRKVFDEVLAAENRIQCAKEDEELAFKFEFMGFQEVSRVVRRVEDINLRRQLNQVLKDFNRRVPTTIDVVCRFCRRKCASSKDIAPLCNSLPTAVFPVAPPSSFVGAKRADFPPPPDMSAYAKLPRAQTAPSGARRHPSRNQADPHLGAPI